METTTGTPPVTLAVTVNGSPQRAFEVFTDRFFSWWPSDYHIGKQDPAEIVIEPHGGGRWFERGPDGAECDWGTVLTWDPPHRLVLAWQINGKWEYEPDLDRASEVELRFVEDGPGRTRVELSHGHLDRHGEAAAAVRNAVSSDGGWPVILQRYVDAVDATA
jgi:uncharacterized protein YndB with AHSA1/START domain